jgi:uncharacterized protein YecE (DUF72 family)
MPSSRRKQETKPTELGPVLDVKGSRVLTGTCSWTDATLVKNTNWYPKKSMPAADRLAYYAKQFPLVEADSTYYRPPTEGLATGWAERTPDGFTFNIKAYSLFTHHPTQPEGLWPDLKEAVKPEFLGKRRLYADHLEPGALDEAWARFEHALRPLAGSGRLGAILLQYPRWFTPKRANREELDQLRERLPDWRLCIEFRSPRWLGDEDRQRTLDVLRANDLALVVVDAPPVSGLATVVEATSAALSVVRFHGRADDTWNSRDVSAAERFRYLYEPRELQAWVPKVRQLAAEAAEVHLLMNNCYQDYGVRNAADLRGLLLEAGAATG